MLKFADNQDGFNLVEISVAMVIFAVVAMIIINMMGNSHNIDAKLKHKDVIATIKQRVVSKTDCDATRNGMTDPCSNQMITVFMKSKTGPKVLIKPYTEPDHTAMFDKKYKYRIKAMCNEYGYFSVYVSKDKLEAGAVKRTWTNLNEIPITCI